MSIRVDTSSLISGALVCGVRGLGVLGSAIPSTGEYGPPPLYNDGLDPDKEYRYLPTSIPAGLSIFFFEDSSFIADPPAEDGTYTVEGIAYEDGVSYGTPKVVLTWGDADATVAAQTLTSTASLIAGTATGVQSAAVAGQTLAAAAPSIAAGSVTAGSSIAAQVLTRTPLLVAGAAVAATVVAGQVLTSAASIVAGAITAASSVAGQMLTVAASIRRGAAIGDKAPAGGRHGRLSIGIGIGM